MTIFEINCIDSFNLLTKEEKLILVDVRTVEEFNSSGIVDSSQFKNETILLPWRLLPDMRINSSFITDLNEALLNKFGDDFEIKIIFACKAGARSFEAAQNFALLGYKNCYNMIGGCEAWKTSGLPWKKD